MPKNTKQKSRKTLNKRAGYIAVAEISPKLFFKNPKPILFDEWQDASKIWGAIRKDCDDYPERTGEYFLLLAEVGGQGVWR